MGPRTRVEDLARPDEEIVARPPRPSFVGEASTASLMTAYVLSTLFDGARHVSGRLLWGRH